VKILFWLLLAEGADGFSSLYILNYHRNIQVSPPHDTPWKWATYVNCNLFFNLKTAFKPEISVTFYNIEIHSIHFVLHYDGKNHCSWLISVYTTLLQQNFRILSCFHQDDSRSPIFKNMGLVMYNLHFEWILNHVSSSAFMTDTSAKTSTNFHDAPRSILFVIKRSNKRQKFYFNLKTINDVRW
jgi:hypothetical protein